MPENDSQEKSSNANQEEKPVVESEEQPSDKFELTDNFVRKGLRREELAKV